MRRPTQKHHLSSKLVILILFGGLLGAALIADLLWASSSSAFRYIASNFREPPSIVADHLHANDSIKLDVKEKKKDNVPGRVLSATFADLPAPELKWEKMASSPVPRLDGAAHSN
ncbi:hypothetical protein Ancab_029247 [Ancistrocladus abbreviatus]